ncbi:hypothetical protein ABTG94_19445, partial [Acinetobacter baumannii]
SEYYFRFGKGFELYNRRPDRKAGCSKTVKFKSNGLRRKQKKGICKHGRNEKAKRGLPEYSGIIKENKPF